jgi:hypothetical protein
MAAEHENWVADLFGTLERDEQAQLFGLLGKLKKGLTSAPAGPSAAHPKTPPRT